MSDETPRRVQIELNVPHTLREQPDYVVEAVVEKDLDILYREGLSPEARCIGTEPTGDDPAGVADE